MTVAKEISDRALLATPLLGALFLETPLPYDSAFLEKIHSAAAMRLIGWEPSPIKVLLYNDHSNQPN